MITSGNMGYLKASFFLENLKKTLVDINDIRNEPLILKIQSKHFYFAIIYIQVL
jgi:hypothetical protein